MTDPELAELIKQYPSMAQAAEAAGIPFTTFKRRAQRLGLYQTNQAGKGLTKDRPGIKYELKDLLIENSPLKKTTTKFKQRLIRDGLLKDVCASCGLSKTWNSKPIVLHLDHVNGKHRDNRLENLRLLCPNCHSQTDTYCGRNVGKAT